MRNLIEEKRRMEEKKLPPPIEKPISFLKRLFPLRNLTDWQKMDVLSIYETVLLHYQIEPFDLLTRERVNPFRYDPKPEHIKEFCNYLEKYFSGRVSFLLIALDEDQDNVLELLNRARQGGSLKMFTVSGSLTAHLKSKEVIPWMKEKNLMFPIKAEACLAKEEVASQLLDVDIEFDSLRPVQQAKELYRHMVDIVVRVDNSIKKLRNLWKSSLFLEFHDTFKKNFQEYTKETIDEWIRALLPDYRGKKN